MLVTAGVQIWSEKIERWPRPRLRGWQTARLRELIAHARERNPFYRRLWLRAGVKEAPLRSLKDLERFPVIAKRDLIAAGKSWPAAEAAPAGFSTRGTSGEPLLVWLSAREQECYIQPTMRGFRWAGFKPGMTALLLSPVWHRLAACEAHAAVRMGGRCAFFWGSMGPEHIDSFLSTLASVRPQFLTTTAPFLLAVVRRADEDAMALRELFKSVRSIVAVGLPLTPRMREYLRDRLGVCDIFERGGTQEGAALDECALHTAPHLHEDVCYAEVLGPDGEPLPAGERGRLVVTKLAAAGSVFVRYDTGDIAAFIPGECPCGCTFRRLKIYGRPESSVTVRGRTIAAYDVRLCIEDEPALLGRNVLLIRPPARKAAVLRIAVEGDQRGEAGIKRRLKERLQIDDAKIVWLGGLKINWGFRQVIDGQDLEIANG